MEVMYNLRIYNEAVYETLKEIAKEERRSVNGLINYIIEQYLKENN